MRSTVSAKASNIAGWKREGKGGGEGREGNGEGREGKWRAGDGEGREGKWREGEGRVGKGGSFRMSS